MRIKRIMAVFAIAAVVLGALCAQAAGERNVLETPEPVRVVALKGPTGMGLSKLARDAEEGLAGAYQFTIAGAIDEVTARLLKGEADIAALPANLASVLYNKTEGKIKVLAINTLGVIYIVENGDTIHSVEDLRGRTIYASGKGATPEYGLNYVLEANGIDPAADLDLRFKSEHAECVAALAADPDGIAMLPEPFVTTARLKNPSIRVALDLTEEWDKLQAGQESPSAMVTGVVVATSDFLARRPGAARLFLEQYQASVEYVNSNVADAAAIIGGLGIVPEKVASLAIPSCNIVFIAGQEMEEKLGGYLAELARQNPKAVGGRLPDEGFYYL